MTEITLKPVCVTQIKQEQVMESVAGKTPCEVRGSSDVLKVKCGDTGLWGGKTSNRILLPACLRVGSVI